MIRSQAIPYIAAAGFVFGVLIVLYLEPFVPRIERELAELRDGAVMLPRAARFMVGTMLVTIQAAAERNERHGNGKLTDGERAALEASIGQELDREARQL